MGSMLGTGARVTFLLSGMAESEQMSTPSLKAPGKHSNNVSTFILTREQELSE